MYVYPLCPYYRRKNICGRELKTTRKIGRCAFQWYLLNMFNVVSVPTQLDFPCEINAAKLIFKYPYTDNLMANVADARGLLSLRHGVDQVYFRPMAFACSTHGLQRGRCYIKLAYVIVGEMIWFSIDGVSQ